MTRRGRARPRIPAGAVPGRDWQWNKRRGSYDGVHTHEGQLTWYTDAGPGGGATNQSFDEFLRHGAPVEAPPAVLAELYALLLPHVSDATPAEWLTWAVEAGDGARIEAAVASGARITRETWKAAKDPAAVEALARAGAADDLAAHVRVLGAVGAYNPAADRRIQEALGGLRDAAADGRDLSAHEGALVAATHEVSHNNDLQRLTQALCWDCVRARDGTRLARLVHETRFGYLLMEELEHAVREGHDIGPMLMDLIEGLNGDREEPLVCDRLVRAIVAHLKKEGTGGLGVIAQRLAGAPEMLRDLVKELHDSGLDVAPALGVVGGAYKRGGESARLAASALAKVSGHADLSAHVASLRNGLKDRKPIARTEAALTLGHEFLRREPPDWSALDELSAHASAAVRSGALIALSSALEAGRDVAEVSSRIALALLDGEDDNHRFAARILKEAMRKGRALAPERAALTGLLQRIDDSEAGPGVERFLHDLAGRGEAESRLVAGVVGDRDGARARELGRACEGYLSGALRRPCSICSFLPADGTWWNDVSLPPEMLRLLPSGDYDQEVGERERRCPECGNAYQTGYVREWDQNLLEETFTLKRIAPPDLHARLVDDLQHPHPEIRSEAKRLLGRA